MKKSLCLLFVLALTMISGASNRRLTKFFAPLKGVDEAPSVFTKGTGFFVGTVSDDGTSVKYKLTFRDMNANVIASHIHFAVPNVAGGIMVFLCATAADPAFPARPVCPAATSGTVEGTFTAADIIGPLTQGIGPGELEKVLRIIDNEVAYVNVHTTQSPAGEIRGQVEVVGHSRH